MPRVAVCHWNAGEIAGRIRNLETIGFSADPVTTITPEVFKRWKQDKPDAVVIDLARLPSHGRDTALHLRKQASTRHVPIVFVGGNAAKTDSIRRLVPDAVYICSWDDIEPALKQAISNPPASPVVPESVFEPYRDVPLMKKLGIGDRSRVVLLDPPDDVMSLLEGMPGGAVISRHINDSATVILAFVRSSDDLNRMMDRQREQLPDGAYLWVIWSKKKGAFRSPVTQQTVRNSGLSRGLVDSKICAISDSWSGLRFTHRKKG